MFWWCSCTQMNVSTWDFDHQLGCQSVNFQRLSNNICSQIPSKLSEDVDYSTWRRKTYFSTKTLVYTKRTIKGRGWILIFILSAWESCVKSQSSFIFFHPSKVTTQFCLWKLKMFFSSLRCAGCLSLQIQSCDCGNDADSEPR